MSVIARRRFLLGASALLAASRAAAQAPGRLPVLGILSPHPRPTQQVWEQLPTTKELGRLGWVAGRTLGVEYGYAEGKEALLPELAAELVRRRCDVIWASGPEAAIAAARATRTVPIVFTGVAYPVEMGLADSLARPGRNATGVAWGVGDSAGYAKPAEFLRAIAPEARRITSIWSAHNLRTIAGEEYTAAYPGFEAAIRALGFEFRIEEVKGPEDYDAAFASILASKSDSIIALTTPLNFRERKRIVEFATRNRLPGAFDLRPFVEIGGLVSYGIVVGQIAVQSVRYIDRILRGASPAELAIELPSRRELAVNLGTARRLGLKVPQAVLIRADRVIE